MKRPSDCRVAWLRSARASRPSCKAFSGRSLAVTSVTRYCRCVRDTPRTDALPPAIRRLIAEGRAVPARRDLHEVLREIGSPPGPVTDAGTRALQEQRGERG